MKSMLIGIVLASAAAMAAAAPLTSGTTTDVPTGPRVASPNRTTLTTLAAATQRNGNGGGNTGGATSTTPLVIDSTGKTVGRALNGPSWVLATYNGQPITFYLWSAIDQTTGRITSPYLFWPSDSLYYATPDCSGQAYWFVAPNGTRYVGVGTKENGQSFLAIFNQAALTDVAFNSFARDGVCNSVSFPTAKAAPLEAVVPTSNFGTEPFSIK